MNSQPEYDFIIVGGGTAGLVVANRLTENPDVSVLILEAGEDRTTDPRITIPGMTSALYDNPEFDWAFRSVPQEHLHGKIISYPRGKTVGGSSAINILAMVYPGKSSIDSWETLGNKGWNWDALAPYYRKFQTYMPPSESSMEALTVDYIDDSIQGSSGPIKSSYPEFVGPLAKAWPGTFKNLGWKVTGDPISGTSLGAFNGPYTVDPNGRVRSHAGNEYYASVSSRKNLHLITNALVERINFTTAKSPSDKPKAQSVTFTQQGQQHTIITKKEIILAAGVFQTPQLLELSGIGSPDILQKQNIPVLVTNPNVGENLQDHCMTGICYEVASGVPTADARRDPSFALNAKQLYETQRSGPLTSGLSSLAFMPLENWVPPIPNSPPLSTVLNTHLKQTPSTSKANPADPSKPSSKPSEQSQFEILRSIISSPTEASIQLCLAPSQMHFNKSTYRDVFAVTYPENYVSLLVSLPHPFSSGNVHITSPSASTPPLIDPHFMSHPLDAEIMGRHMLALEKIVTTEPLASLIKKGGKRLPEGVDVGSLEKAKEFVRGNLRSTSHPCGTAAMGLRERGGVVDERLRVYGVEGVRVVDASCFPMVPRGNIQSSVYAVAERGAEMVRGEWGI